ncbi:uncharacterized protein LOC135471906 [Liolophura sinensis]|uniref:uncharacterized protein LOC135471906 n=1 Tax=Liolophura sinensis TaxID=3198878 RepID=UPI0031591DA5
MHGLVFLALLASLCTAGYGTSVSVHTQTDTKPSKTWLFSTDANRKPYFFEDKKGVLQGFTVDLVNKVCSVAGEKCAFTVNPFVECVRTINNRFYPGRGIMAGWFDACPGYLDTAERLNAVDFTQAFTSSSARFQVLPGNPREFHPANVTGSTITFLNGAATGAQCLTRLGKTGARFVVASGIEEAKDLLTNGTADALFSPRSSIPGFDTLPDRLQCGRTGSAVLVKKGSPIPDWWNPAFDLFRATGGYKDLCDKSATKYGVPVKNCFQDATRH